jgi:hypothetical protein
MVARRLALAVNLPSLAIARSDMGAPLSPDGTDEPGLEVCSMLITSRVGQFFPMRLNLYGIALIRLEPPSPVVRWPM